MSVNVTASKIRYINQEKRLQEILKLISETAHTPATDWGTRYEGVAIAMYTARTGRMVEKGRFICHPVIPGTGAAPDGFVEDDGLIEAKCPSSITHLRWIVDGVVPSDYKDQLQWEMACTGRKWVDFVSYDPRMPAGVQLFIAREHRDEDYIKDIENRIQIFKGDLKC